jgi:threonine aldolase
VAKLPGIKLDASRVQTNIVIFEIVNELESPDVTKRLAERQILASGIGPKHIRFVTHMDVSRGDCEQALAAMQEIFS